MIKKTKALKQLSTNDFKYLNGLSLVVSRCINSDKETSNQMQAMKQHAIRNGKKYALGRLNAELIAEGTKAFTMLKTAVCLQLGRGLNRGELKRLTWLVSGSKKRLTSGKMARNITAMAKESTLKHQDIRGSQAIKNIA